jgi:hypothetical protein
MGIVELENLKHYAMVEGGVVTNVVVWDGVTEYEPDADLVLIEGLVPEPGIGWDYDGKKFSDNRPKENLFDL